MTLLFMDGFDHYATADINKKWDISGGGTIFATGGRRNSGYYQLNNPTKKFIPQRDTVIVGHGFNITSASTTNVHLGFYDSVGAAYQIGIYVDSNGAFKVYRNSTAPAFNSAGGTLIGQSANGAFKFGMWLFVEVKVVIHDTTGSVEIRVEGVTVLNLTNVDTKHTANAWVDQIVFGAASGNSYIDDLYINDNQGSVNNNFLGDVRIDAYLPNADGTNSAFTPSTGTSHFALVDETVPNTTDYNDGVNVGDKDTYNFTDMSHTPASIFATQLCLAAAKDDSGARSVKPVTRSGGTNYVGSAFALSTSQLYATEIREVDPATSAAWTKANLNAAEFGAEVA